jgi:hypothetical protein
MKKIILSLIFAALCGSTAFGMQEEKKFKPNKPPLYELIETPNGPILCVLSFLKTKELCGMREVSKLFKALFWTYLGIYDGRTIILKPKCNALKNETQENKFFLKILKNINHKFVISIMGVCNICDNAMEEIIKKIRDKKLIIGFAIVRSGQNVDHLTSRSLDEIAKLPNLEKFALIGFSFDDEIDLDNEESQLPSYNLKRTDIENFFEKTKNLKEIYLDHLGFADMTVNFVFPLVSLKAMEIIVRNNPQLEVLSMQDNFTNTIEGEEEQDYLKETLKLKNLKVLDLNGWAVSQEEALQILKELDKLKWLNINSRRFIRDGINLTLFLIASKIFTHENLERINLASSQSWDSEEWGEEQPDGPVITAINLDSSLSPPENKRPSVLKTFFLE